MSVRKTATKKENGATAAALSLFSPLIKARPNPLTRI